MAKHDKSGAKLKGRKDSPRVAPTAPKSAKEKKSINGAVTHPSSKTNVFIEPLALYDSNQGKQPPVAGSKGTHINHSVSSVLMQSKPESQMTTIEKMEATQKGISKKELEQLKEKAGLDYDQLAFILDVARATLIAKKGTDKFAPSLSERIMSLAQIYSYGYEVFGSREEFNHWIFQPISAFAGKAPFELLNSQYGREEVGHVIGRIQYGVYS